MFSDKRLPVLGNHLVNHIFKADFPDQIILFHIVTPRIKKRLLRIAFNFIQFRFQSFRNPVPVVFNHQLCRCDRNFNLMNPEFDILLVLFRFFLVYFHMLFHSFPYILKKLSPELFLLRQRRKLHFSNQIGFLHHRGYLRDLGKEASAP